MGLSNLEVYWVVNELKSLEGGYWEKIWKLEKGYKMRIRKDGANDIILNPPDYIYLTKYEFRGQEPDPLVMKIRKELDRAKLLEILQPNFDRIVEFRFDNGKRLIIELFSHGNIILVDKDGKTKISLRRETWKDREIRPGKPYKYPQSPGLNPIEMKLDEFKKIFNEKDVIRSLVKSIKLGKNYLYEACFLAGEEPNSKSPKDPEKLFKLIKDMLRKKNPGIQGIPVVFRLESSNEKFIPKPSFNQALDDFYSEKKEYVDGRGDKEIEKLERRLKRQLEAMRKLENDSKLYKEIGDLIYQNYQKLEKTLENIKKLRKEGKDWREIERELGVKINEKEGKVEVHI